MYPEHLTKDSAAPHDKVKRDLEIEELYDGDAKSWLEDRWHLEKRSLPLEELHKRWWSGNIRVWLDKMKGVDATYTGIRHRIFVRPQQM
jgi:chitinase